MFIFSRGEIVIYKQKDRIICAVLILIMAAALIKSFVIDPGNGKIPVGRMIQLNDRWETVTQEEGYSEYKYAVPRRGAGNLVFSMKHSWASVELFLGDRMVYSYRDTYKELGARRLWYELPREASGRILTMRIIGSRGMAERMMQAPIYLGEKNAVFLESLKESFHAFVFFVFTFILTIIIGMCEISLRAKLSKSSQRKLRYLEFFILDTGMWVLTDSQVLQILTEKTAVVEIMSFSTFLLMPLLLILFIREMMAYPWKIFTVLLRAGSVNAILILTMYLFRILPIYTLLFLQHILVLITIPVILEKSITEIKKYRNEGMKKIAVGIGILSVCAVTSLGMFYINSSIDYTYFYSVGFCLFMMCLAWSVFEEICYHLEMTAKAEIYKNMAYRDGMTGMENRTAFEKMLERNDSAEGLTYIMFDNNNLKRINDTCGHQAGDRILVETAECIKETFERMGRCFRIGGDEFLVIIQGMSEDEVKRTLEYFESRLEEVSKKAGVPIETAYGYFLCRDSSMTLRELFEKADENMYAKKQRMKNKDKKEKTE